MKKVVLLFLFLLSCTSLAESNNMKLSSPAFENEGVIPSEYTCDGENKIIPLQISEVPENTVSLALIFDDPDAPVGTWDHWILWNIPPNTTKIDSELEVPHGKNSWGKLEYGGPCPPDKEHTYHFKLYALNTKLDLPEGSTKQELENAMKNHIIEKAVLKGRYKRI